MNKAVVIGGNHHNTLGVIRSLGRKGLRPDVLGLYDRMRDIFSYAVSLGYCGSTVSEYVKLKME